MGRWLGVWVLLVGCAPAELDDDPGFAHDPSEASRDPGPGSRARASAASPCDQIVALAVAEENRGPSAVGQDLTGYPGKLSSYLSAGEAWCSEFVSWVYKAAGYPLSGGSQGGWMIKDSVSLRTWFQKQSEWVAKGSASWSTFTPEPGDFIRYNNSSGGHSGMVREVSGTTLLTVEGNVNNKVMLLKLQSWRSVSSIDGIGRRKLGCTVPPPSPDLGPAPKPDLGPASKPDLKPAPKPDLKSPPLPDLGADRRRSDGVSSLRDSLAPDHAAGTIPIERAEAGAPPARPNGNLASGEALHGGCALASAPCPDLLVLALLGLAYLGRRRR